MHNFAQYSTVITHTKKRKFMMFKSLISKCNTLKYYCFHILRCDLFLYGKIIR